MDRERVAGLAVATFEHATSREQDPQLHTHCLVANVALRQDGTASALDGRHLYRWKMAWARCTGGTGRATAKAGFPSRSIGIGPVSRFAACPRLYRRTFPNGRTRFRSGWPRTVPRGESGGSSHLEYTGAQITGDRSTGLVRPLAGGRARAGLGPEQAAQRLARSA